MTLKNLINDAKAMFEKKMGYPCTALVTCPGRINILGEHTDYLGGVSLPAAINRWTVVAYAPARGQRIRAFSQEYQKFWETCCSSITPPKQVDWTMYLYGALDLQRKTASDSQGGESSRVSQTMNKTLKHGLDLVILGNVPLGKGVSSSASLSLALVHSLASIYATKRSEMTCALLAQKIENDYIGVPSGLLDQFACQFSKKAQVHLVDFSTHSITKAVLASTEPHLWVALDTKIQRKLAGSSYAKRVQECKQAMEIIQSLSPEISCYRDIKAPHLLTLKSSPNLQLRMRHMLEENARVFQGFNALQEGNLSRLGILLNESHASLRDFFAVSCGELDALQERAMAHEGCYGARMMGGGFGGCTINLVKAGLVEDFCQDVLSAYKNNFGIASEAYLFSLEEGVKIHLQEDHLDLASLTSPHRPTSSDSNAK